MVRKRESKKVHKLRFLTAEQYFLYRNMMVGMNADMNLNIFMP